MAKTTKTKPAAAPATEAKAAPRTKKVLTERDFLKPGQKTQAEQKAELAKELGKERAKLPTALAKGVEGRQNPHSSKAVADERAKTKPATAPKAATKPKPAAAPKTAKDASAKLTILVKAKDSSLKPGSDRFLRLQAIEKCKTLGEALAVTIPGDKRIAMDNIRGMENRGHVKIG